jgi:hypothetical protein
MKDSFMAKVVLLHTQNFLFGQGRNCNDEEDTRVGTCLFLHKSSLFWEITAI